MGEFTLPLLNDFQRKLLADEIPLVLNPIQDVLWLVAYLIAFVLVDLMLLNFHILSHLLLFDVAKVLLAAV